MQDSATILRRAIEAHHRASETTVLPPLAARAQLDPALAAQVVQRARRLAAAARALHQPANPVDAFMREYDLSSEEGVLLMCLAEALLRIPDHATQERLIVDKLSRGQWDQHLGRSPSLLVNASTWALLLTGRTLQNHPADAPLAGLRRLSARLGAGVARVAMTQAMEVLGQHFVAGGSIEAALQRTAKGATGAAYSYDCLGEAAQTAADVDAYLHAYKNAIDTLGARPVAPDADPWAGACLSIKLSALHPRYEFSQRDRVLAELVPRLQELVAHARCCRLGVTLDAEESDRLELSLDVFAAVLSAEPPWNGFGIAVQTYQKRALPVLHWLRHLAQQSGARIPVRLVKGAYWDTEIKRAQELGLSDYPVFTRKAATDTSYLACARYILEHEHAFYGQFATHNAYAITYVQTLARPGRTYEFQRLHGMGANVYAALAQASGGPHPPCRIYAPVGSHEQLLPYLVRRLLENGANNSFVNQAARPDTDLDQLIQDPVAQILATDCTPHPQIPAPQALYGSERRNALGIDLAARAPLDDLQQQLRDAEQDPWHAGPLIDGRLANNAEPQALYNPAQHGQTIGTLTPATGDDVDNAMRSAAAAMPDWDAAGADARAACLDRAADLWEQAPAPLIARIVREGGRTLADAVAEVRETVDFCRYYAQQARRQFGAPQILPGPVGEHNSLRLQGRGVFACISPWNFPAAIFAGQVAAALAAGNAVIAKPAQATPLCGHYIVQTLQQAGVPGEVLQFLPGSGATVGPALVRHPQLAGIAFTGSSATAWGLQSALAQQQRAIVPFIAETGGVNVMIADSSALPEQAVHDILRSAFNSAGQRCSALRVLFVQDSLAESLLARLSGAMDQWRIGDPWDPTTDMGPLISAAARAELQGHDAAMRRSARLVHALELPAATDGYFFAPRVFEVQDLAQLPGEVFGPVLHVIRYDGAALDSVLDAVNGAGYGLTLGVHSRIEATWEHVQARARVGNLYINRNMIGAVVGVQPFGGEGLSGTGPKAGGPYYLPRFGTERTVSINTAALGGDPRLLNLD